VSPVHRDFDPPPGPLAGLVARALAEDLGVLGDLTTLALVGDDETGAGWIATRQDGILAGTAAATEVYRQVDPDVQVTWDAADGEEIPAGARLARLEGPLRAILMGERTALNFLQHCSGVATLTRRFVRAAHGRARIRDTRKTLPGLRALEKAAVRAGGGFNHRECLSDAVLVKDNHLRRRSVAQAVARARARWPGRVVEVECDTPEQVTEAVAAGADLVLLDNMTPEMVAEVRARVGEGVRLEVSGGVTLDRVGAFAEAGADFVSVGAITHSAPALDIGLDLD